MDKIKILVIAEEKNYLHYLKVALEEHTTDYEITTSEALTGDLSGSDYDVIVANPTVKGKSTLSFFSGANRPSIILMGQPSGVDIGLKYRPIERPFKVPDLISMIGSEVIEKKFRKYRNK